MFDPKPLPTEEQDGDLVAAVNVTIRDLREGVA